MQHKPMTLVRQIEKDTGQQRPYAVDISELLGTQCFDRVHSRGARSGQR
jgi:hypothetical protein